MFKCVYVNSNVDYMNVDIHSEEPKSSTMIMNTERMNEQKWCEFV